MRVPAGGVMARGNRRGAIFEDDQDRHSFLQALGEACRRTGWRAHGWVLMGNHYHLLIETPEANLVAGMQWLNPVQAGLVQPRAGSPTPSAVGEGLWRRWYWGSQAFAERVLKLGEALLRKNRHRSAYSTHESRAHGELDAARLLRDGLNAAGLRPGALGAIKGSDPRKVAIARVIWQKTTVSHGLDRDPSGD